MTVAIEDPWLRSAISEIGLPVLRVRHALPARERILVTRPLVVVISREVRSDDIQLVARAAALVGARAIEAGYAEEGRVVGEILRAIEASDSVVALPAPQRAVGTER